MNRSNRHQIAPVGKHPDRPSHPTHEARRALGPAEEPPEEIAGGFSRVFRRLLLPVVCTVPVGLIFLTVLTAAAYFSADPTALLLPLSCVALGLTSVAGGIIAGKIHGDGWAGGSLACGGLFAVLLSIVALMAGGGEAPLSSAVLWALRLSPIPLHLLGGWVARPRPRAAKHAVGAGHHAHRP